MQYLTAPLTLTDMNQIIDLPNCRICWVTVPIGVNLQDISISYLQGDPDIIWRRGKDDYVFLKSLPSGNWQLLGKVSEITEELAMQFVDKTKRLDKSNMTEPTLIVYRDYLVKECWYDSPLESFHSFTSAYSIPKDAVLMIERK